LKINPLSNLSSRCFTVRNENIRKEYVKPPAYKAGLPGKDLLFYIFPFLPAPPSVGTGADRQGPRLQGGTGSVPVKLNRFFKISLKMAGVVKFKNYLIFLNQVPII
jgi:hypothetical protein